MEMARYAHGGPTGPADKIANNEEPDMINIPLEKVFDESGPDPRNNDFVYFFNATTGGLPPSSCRAPMKRKRFQEQQMRRLEELPPHKRQAIVSTAESGPSTGFHLASERRAPRTEFD